MKNQKIRSVDRFVYPVAFAIGYQLELMQGKIYDDSQIEISLMALHQLLQENDETKGAFIEETTENPDIYQWSDHILVPNPELDGISFVIGGLIEKSQPDDSKT